MDLVDIGRILAVITLLFWGIITVALYQAMRRFELLVHKYKAEIDCLETLVDKYKVMSSRQLEEAAEFRARLSKIRNMAEVL